MQQNKLNRNFRNFSMEFPKSAIIIDGFSDQSTRSVGPWESKTEAADRLVAISYPYIVSEYIPDNMVQNKSLNSNYNNVTHSSVLVERGMCKLATITSPLRISVN